MRVVFVGDLHLDVHYHRGRQAGRHTVLYRDSLSLFREVLQAAREADLLVLGGDVFHVPQPPMPVLLTYQHMLLEFLLESRAAVAVTAGNHDTHPSGTLPVSMALLYSFSNHNLFHARFALLREPGDVARLTLPSGEEVHILGLPWLFPHNAAMRLRLQTDGGDFTYDELNRILDEALAGSLERLPQEGVRLLVGHAEVVDPGETPPPGHALRVQLPRLLNAPHLDAALFGHGHQPRHWPETPPHRVVVGGSLFPVDFGETWEHGYWLLEIRPGEGIVEAEFRAAKIRPWVVVNVRLPQEADREACREALVREAERVLGPPPEQDFGPAVLLRVHLLEQHRPLASALHAAARRLLEKYRVAHGRIDIRLRGHDDPTWGSEPSVQVRSHEALQTFQGLARDPTRLLEQVLRESGYNERDVETMVALFQEVCLEHTAEEEETPA